MKETSIPNWLFLTVLFVLAVLIVAGGIIINSLKNDNTTLTKENAELHTFYQRYPSNMYDAVRVAIENELNGDNSGLMEYNYGWEFNDGQTHVKSQTIIRYEIISAEQYQLGGILDKSGTYWQLLGRD